MTSMTLKAHQFQQEWQLKALMEQGLLAWAKELCWSWEDDDGVRHDFRIPNSYYVPSAIADSWVNTGPRCRKIRCDVVLDAIRMEWQLNYTGRVGDTNSPFKQFNMWLSGSWSCTPKRTLAILHTGCTMNKY
jgi:hypothetical protein